VYQLTGIPLSEHQRGHDHRTVPARYRARLVGLAPERAALYRQIDQRVDAMVAAGLVAEVERLRAAGFGPALRSQAAIGYAELHRHLDGQCSLAEAIELVKRNSRRYARRQLSWYRPDPDVEWRPSAAEVDVDGLGRYLASSAPDRVDPTGGGTPPDVQGPRP
jgi:tRNA dimethylallyltransferase